MTGSWLRNHRSWRSLPNLNMSRSMAAGALSGTPTAEGATIARATWSRASLTKHGNRWAPGISGSARPRADRQDHLLRGVAATRRKAGLPAIQLADALLYEAKNCGRDQVRIEPG